MHKFNKISFTKFYAIQEFNMTINIQYTKYQCRTKIEDIALFHKRILLTF